MKTRTSKTARPIAVHRRRFALHPLSFAICLAMSTAALALPQGGSVVAGNATIGTPSHDTEIVRQTSDKAIIDWRSFSIAAGEKVRFYQPSSSAVTLNRVTGYDPSSILGRMSSNGRIFLVNPYGVVFGAGARVDVGGLVVSSLSIANSDFLASRYSLTSVDPAAPAQRGEVRNDGTISAPGGLVVLAGPGVTNTGTIVATGGRVGLVAANSVSIDVEGDGLIFFQANASEAKNRLQQLGRIQADGGTVEMRAEARGAFADTVLNMSGVVQARGLGSRDGRVVIDGGSEGVTVVSGQIDVSGRAGGGQGGTAIVEGQQVALTDTSRIDASGDAAGGAIRIGGGFHGRDPNVRNATETSVAAGAQLAADAVTSGNGGTVAVWSDHGTSYQGSTSARGGAQGGDGGFVEVSGRDSLAYDGLVDTRAPNGRTGTLLLDPTDITISTSADTGTMTPSGGDPNTFTDTVAQNSNLNTTTLQTALGSASVIVDTTSALGGTGTIVVQNPILDWAGANSLTLKADSTITVNAAATITNTGTGGVNLFTNGGVVLNAAVALSGGSFTVADKAGSGRAASFTSGGGGTITTTGPNGVGANGTPGGNVAIATSGDIVVGNIAARGGNGPAGFNAGSAGNVVLTTTNGAITTGSINITGGAGSSKAGGAVGGKGGDVTITAAGGSPHALVTGTITVLGGKGSDDSTAAGQGGTGGAGGTISVTNSTLGNSTLQPIDSTGGLGGAALVGNTAGGDGGAAGSMTLTANGGTLAVGNLTAVGGAGGAGHGSSGPGTAGASQAIALNFEQASAGTLDLTNATLSGASATATGVGTGTLVVANAGGSTFNITGAGSGDVVGVSYSGVANLTGGAGSDTFKLGSTVGAGLTGNIVGGGGGDTLDVAAQTGALVVNLQTSKYTQGGTDRIGGTFSGIGAVKGSDPLLTTNTTLVGPNGPQTFNITNPNTGNVAGVAFTQVGNLTGGTGNDGFVFAAAGTLSGAINGGAGSNSLDLSAKAGPVVLNQQTGTGTDNGAAVFSGFSNIGSFAGNATNTEIVGSNAGQTFTLAGDLAGTAGSLAFTGVTKLTGGSGGDTLVVANDLAAITLTDTSIARTGMTAITLASIESASLTGGAGANAITASGFAGNVTVNATAGADTVTGNGVKTTLVGTNNPSTFTIDDPATLTSTLVEGANTTTFKGVGNLTGGSANDTFAFTNSATASLAGNIVGGGGVTNMLDVSQQPGALVVNLQTGKFTQGGTDLIGGAFSGINAVKGSDPAATTNTILVGPNGPQTFNVANPNAGNVAGVAFTQVGNLTGGTGSDTFVVAAAGALSGAINGGGGSNALDLSALATANFGLASATSGTASGIAGGYSNVATLVGNGNSTLTGTNTASTFIVNANDAGTVDDGIGTTSFSQVKNLTGGSANDRFAITGTAVLSGNIVGGGASNALDLSGYANPVTVSATASTATGLTGTFSGISDFKGSDGNTTLTASAAGSIFNVTGANSGDVAGLNYTNVGNLTGGAGSDTFKLGSTVGAGLTGNIVGGGGGDTLDVAAQTGALVVNLQTSKYTQGGTDRIGGTFSGIGAVKGSDPLLTTNTTLVGPNGPQTFNITNPNTGNVAGVAFTQVGNLTGGTGNDGFVFAAAGTLSGAINGGAGSNSLDLSAKAGPVVLNQQTGTGTDNGAAVFSGFSNIGSFAGNATNTEIVGSNAGQTFTLAGDLAGTAGSLAFTGVTKLTGGSGGDTLVVANDLAAITLTDTSIARTGMTAITLASIESASLTGGAGANAITASGFAGNVTVNATAGADTVTGNGVKTTLVGTNNPSTFTVSANDTGTLVEGVNTTNFSAVGNLSGGTASDTFAITGTAVLGGNIVGGGANNILDLSGYADPVMFNLPAGTATGVGGAFSGISSVVGNGAATTVTGSAGGSTFNVTGLDSGDVGSVAFSGAGSLLGGAGPDNFVIANAGSLTGNINGGGGVNSLDLSARAAANFGLTSASSGNASGVVGGYGNIGTLIGNPANTTLTGTNAGSIFTVSGGNSGTVFDGIGTTTFSGVRNLVGGTGPDSFVVANAGSLAGTIDGGALGVNTLDLSARAAADLGLASASSGTASGVTGGYSNVTTLIGNPANTTVTGTNAGSIYSVSGGNSGTVFDGVGTTTFSGVRNLVGGTGADSFVVANAGSLAGSIDGGSGGVNTLDLGARAAADFGLASASSGTASGVAGAYSNVTTLVGNPASTTLTGTNAASTYTVSGANGGNINGATTFGGVRNLVGGTGADNFVITNAGSLAGSIDGGIAGVNTLDLSARAAADFGLASAASGTASGLGGGYSNVTTLVGNGGTSTLTGSNAASTYTITANNAGTVNDGLGTTSFNGVPNLVGGTAADSYVLGTGLALGSIDGGTGGANSLATTAAAAENLTLANTLLARSVAGPVTLANISSATLTGGGGSNTIDASGWTGGRTVVINASAGNDTVVGNGVGTTLVGTAAASTFNIAGPDSGTLSDGVNVTTLSGVGNLVGGVANDTFLIQNAGTLTGNLDGGGGLNTLDLSNKSTATIVFNTSNSTVTGVGIAGTLSNIGALVGNVTNTTLQGSAGGQSFAITGNNEITVNGSQVFKGVGNLAADVGPDSIIGTTFSLAGSISDAGGTTSLSGTIQTVGSQTYSGPVTLVADTTLTATGPGSPVTLGSTTDGAFRLAVNAAATTFGSAVGAGTALTGVTLSGNTAGLNAVTTSGAQNYGGVATTTLNGALTVNTAGAGVSAGATTLAAGGGAITLTGSNAANDVTLGTVNGAQALNITAGGGDIVLGAVGAGTALTGVTLSGNTAGLNAVTTSGAQNYGGVATTTLNGALTVNTAGAGVSAGATTLAAGGGVITLTGSNAANDVTLGTVNGAQALNITAGGGDIVLGAVGAGTALTGVTLSGNTAGLNAVTTSGAQNYGGVATTTLNGALTVNTAGAGVSAGATTLAAGGGAITLTGSNAANDVTLGTVNGAQALNITAGGGDIVLGAVGAGTALTGVTLSGNTAGLNAVTTSGAQNYGGVATTTLNGALTVNTAGAGVSAGATTLAAGGGAITLTGSNAANDVTLGTVNGAQALNITAGGGDIVLGAVGAGTALTGVTLSGNTAGLNAVTTSGAQNYGGVATTTLNGALTVNTAGAGVSAGATTLAAGGGVITLTGSNAANDVTLGTVNGAQALNITAGGGDIVLGAVGAGTALTGVTLSGNTAGLNAVTTSGAQNYGGVATTTLNGALTVNTAGAGVSAGATTLAAGGGAITLTGSNAANDVTLGTVNGAQALNITAGGGDIVLGAVGATTPLPSLTANGTTTMLGGNATTTGGQTYTGSLTLAGSTTLTGSALTLGGPVSGAVDLTLQTNSLTGGNSIVGTGVLTIAPIDSTLSIGVAGGAGALQVPQAVLDGASGFTAHVIGRTDGSGTISAGNLVLRSDTTLQTASGDIILGGSVDGAFALTLNSGGTTRITGPVGVTTPLKSLSTDNNAAATDWDGTSGERTTFDNADGSGSARVVTTGAQTYDDPLTASVPIAFTGGAITATQGTNRFDAKVSAVADSLQVHSSADLQLGTITLANGGAVDTDGVLHLTGALQLNGGTLVLTAKATPSPIDLTDPDAQGKTFTFGFVPVKEASATIVEEAGATLASAPGSLIAFRSPAGGTLQLDQPGNTLLGTISAVSGALGDNDLARFNNASAITLGFVRIVSSEIHVAGAPPRNGDQTVVQAGLEGDVVKLSADVLTTGTDGLIRARLPFNNVQGSQTSIPGITFIMTPTALATGSGFGSPASDTFVRVQVGGVEGGFITARPKGASGNNAVIFLGGAAEARPFYDGNGKLTEIRIFYNGDAPRTPQEAGALAAVIALIEEARHARFEEAVRTENVSSRLRSGVIAEVGAGRPATVGRESIRPPATCEVKPGTLRCE